MEQKDDEPPPFWLQSTTTLHQVDHHRRRHRQASSLFLNTGVLVMFLLVTAVIFLVIVIPSVASLSRQVFNPRLVKSSWSSLNIVLVIFAVVCGFLSRKDSDQTPVNTPTRKEYEYPEKLSFKDFGDLETIPRLRRSSSSYPDLRQESNLILEENKWRYYDDTDVYNHQLQRIDSQIRRTRSFRRIGGDEDHVETKNIEVDTFARKTRESTNSSPSPSVIEEDESSSKNIDVPIFLPSPPQYMNIPPMNILTPPSPDSYFWLSPPPPPPLPPPLRQRHSTIPTKKKTNQTFETIGYGRYKWNNTSEVTEPKSKEEQRGNSSIPSKKKTIQTFETIGHGRYKWNNTSEVREPKSKEELPPPPPPRSRLVVAAHYTENKQGSSERKRGGVNVTKDFFSSFYHQSKRKRKHKRRSYENLENLTEPSNSASIHRSKSTPEFPPSFPPPPPPPPLPPNSAFHNLFSKKGKNKKKVQSPSSTPQPPPPPPPPPPLQTRPTKDKTKVKPEVPKKPFKAMSFSSMYDDDDKNGAKGNESPFRPTPPPPPPPPFKMKPWKFVKQGDYVKIKSNNNIPSSGYSSSEDENSSSQSQPLFSPSPDVNIKAEDFIARFRAKLTLEKSDSINLNQGTGTSRLRPDS